MTLKGAKSSKKEDASLALEAIATLRKITQN